MKLSEFIEELQVALTFNGDGEVKTQHTEYDGYGDLFGRVVELEVSSILKRDGVYYIE